MSFTVKTIESKTTPKKKKIELKNIAVDGLCFIDAETGENITDSVVKEIPEGVDTLGFKLVFELPNEEDVLE